MSIAKVQIIQDGDKPHIIKHVYINGVDVADITRDINIKYTAVGLPEITLGIYGFISMSEEMQMALNIKIVDRDVVIMNGGES